MSKNKSNNMRIFKKQLILNKTEFTPKTMRKYSNGKPLYYCKYLSAENLEKAMYAKDVVVDFDQLPYTIMHNGNYIMITEFSSHIDEQQHRQFACKIADITKSRIKSSGYSHLSENLYKTKLKLKRTIYKITDFINTYKKIFGNCTVTGYLEETNI